MIFAPAAVSLKPRETIKIPTGIRAEIQEGWVLQLFLRSSLGFTYRLQFNNTVGIIDSDYFEATTKAYLHKNDERFHRGKTVQIRKGDGFAQGPLFPFGICEDDDVQKQRNSGFGVRMSSCRTLNLRLFPLCDMCTASTHTL